ncbi:hypothetical protein EYF80_031109 [Liparis tanakae]|uniref:Uncharacterized protein n=1 Tax=Liparis tanakae TaxID=230148 RepID=A0A4Z2H011_9TELE|nr:hypothetical protein EYF80_031109 [Liparis tanakae]
MAYRVPGRSPSSSAEVSVFGTEMFFHRTRSGSVSRTLKRSARPGPPRQDTRSRSDDKDATWRLWTDDGAGGQRQVVYVWRPETGGVCLEDRDGGCMSGDRLVSPVEALRWTGGAVLLPAEATTLTVYEVPGTRELKPDRRIAESWILVLNVVPESESSRVTSYQST